MLSCFYEKDPEELVQSRDSLPGVGAVEHPCSRHTGVYIAVLQNDPVGLPVCPVPDTHPAERLCGKPCVLVSCLRQITTTRGFKQQTGSLSQVAEVQTQDAGGSVPWEALGESRPPVSWMSRGAASAPRVQGLPSSLRPCFPGVLPLRVSAGSGSCRPPTRTSAVGLRAL